MPIYNKLVRDKVPEVIQKNGKSYSSRTLSQHEYEEQIRLKLQEEIAEYLAADTAGQALEELADVLEVIHSLVGIHNSSFHEVETIRKQKSAERGGFKKRVFLEKVDD
ncbi:putative house-cleaning noncanonical NTP pyrophosphatase (MazG superfamily) [Alkalihalobacillus xiaoxiensis]|uniref:House-cleaning noncanonical NTP pyrophosphatase (MazG superfamily) n=1 Tax=Shouchella xiaoxiensis TaxID=766895 RepID=A0ABS2SV80_9BACI|nr:nucleoside triphosphate pyrophosphohydrolase [Shouchella xiaoxiensis]MBM7839086.1 putative house-cleaning noncanonical NTP pyrophosphatase (MazG superfamily) [Shouchella xiaoxiensis]